MKAFKNRPLCSHYLQITALTRKISFLLVIPFLLAFAPLKTSYAASSISLVKSSTSTYNAPNQNINYSYLVENTGSDTLSSISISDNKIPSVSIHCPPTTLIPNASLTCTGTYTTTQADVDTGSITNTATASGINPSNVTITSTPFSATVDGSLTPSISMTKTANTANYNAAGQNLSYTYAVTNTGNQTLSSIAITDNKITSTHISCAATSLAPGDTTNCTGTYTTTQADVDAGSVTNKANATSKSPQSNTITSSQSSQTVNAVLLPSLSLLKSTTRVNFSTPGVSISYSYLITNTGNNTISSISLTDNKISGIICPVTTLAPNATTTCTAVYTTTQADVDAGEVSNTGSVTGKSPQGTVVNATYSISVPAVQNPALSMTKSTSTEAYTAAGQNIDFSYTVKNTGNQTLTDIAITDIDISMPSITCGTTILAPNASTLCSGVYTTTQADVDAGSVKNTATASGQNESSTVATSNPSSVIVYAIPSPSISVIKSSPTTNFDGPNQSIQYSYVVNNTGNETLSSLTISDNKVPGSDISCPLTTLVPGDSTTCTATYNTTQGDVDSGGVTNQAMAVANAPNGVVIKSSVSSASVPATQNPSITMNKSSSTTSFNQPNQAINYSYVVTNTGNDTLNSITITDSKIPPDLIDCPVTQLAPNASTTCTALYQVTQADIDAGSVTNTASASGTNGQGTTVSSSTSSKTVPAEPQPGLSVDKSTTTSLFNAANQSIQYSYLIKNTGNNTISSLAIIDNRLPSADISCEATSLAPNTSTTCTGVYQTTQADVDAGNVTNTSMAAGNDPQGVSVTSAASDVLVPATQTQAVSLTKSANPTSYDSAGTLITYYYLVENTGNLTLNPISITDPHPGLTSITCPVSSLAPGISTTCTATYTTTTDDINAGSISNKGTVSATSPIGVTTAVSSVTIQGPILPAISINKTANTSAFSSAGTLITYYYQVQNTGNLVLNTLNVTDPHAGLSAISCPVTSLAPGAQTTCTATYTTTAADVSAGSISNTGSVTANSSSGSVSASSSTLTIPLSSGELASLAFTKSANISSYNAPGGTVTYNYLVQNTGEVPLTFNIVDPHSGLSAIDCPQTTLAAGDSTTCTAMYTISQADVDAGTINNTATVSSGSLLASSTVIIPGVQSPSISLLKTSSTASYDAPSQIIHYSYLITNNGNQTLTGMALSDDKVTANNISCAVTTLAPNASTTCTGIYSTIQTDVDAGNINNTATVSAQNSQASVVTAQSNATVDAVLAPSLSVTKSTSTTSYNAPGQTLTYSYLVKNTGNDTINNIIITDNLVSSSSITCLATTLAPDMSTTCTGTYTTTLADLDTGKVVNTSITSGQNDQGTSVTSAPSTVTIVAMLMPAMTLTKSTTATTYNTPGQSITYNYVVTNTGNDTLNNIAIRDNKISSANITCLASTLAPGASTTCSGTYKTTQGDIDAAKVTNSAQSVAQNNQGTSVISPTASTTVPATLSPSIALVKSSTTSNYKMPNQLISYNYVITNTGNDTLSSIALTDNKISAANISCPGSTLAPYASMTCTAVYITTQADVDAGNITNVATTSSKNPQGTIVTSNSSTVTVTAVLTPAISLAKSTTATGYNAAGQNIPYSYLVKNTGNDTLSNITISDNKITGAINCLATILAPGMSTTCTATYVVTQPDIDIGVLMNTATASGQNTQGTNVTSLSSSTTLIATQSPAISLVKSSTTANYDAIGDLITYNYLVKNTGNDTLNTITISDNKVTAALIHCPVTSLAPGVSTTCTGTYTVVLADLNNAQLTNTATASGKNFQGTTAKSAVSSVTVPAVITSSISLVKSKNTTSYNGNNQSLHYSYLVTNTGNDSINSIAIADDKVTPANITCPTRTLAPGASTTCTGTYTTTQADVDAGFVTNTATASAKNPQNTPVTSVPSSATVPAIQSPALTLLKSSITANYNMSGESIVYHYKVTNTGNDTINLITITDDHVPTAQISCPVTTLAPNASTICTGSYTTTQADVDAGSVTNTATSSGQNAQATSVTSPSSSVTVDAILTPMLSIVKSTTTTSYTAVGQTITYSYLVTNTGNDTIHGLSIADNKVASANINCPIQSLNPGNSTTCTGTYTTTQADVDAGNITNIATANGLDSVGNPATSQGSTVTVNATLSPALSIMKSGSPTSFNEAGQAITYTYQVSNTGNNTLSLLYINDTKIPTADITCLTTTLAPNESTTCSSVYTTTQSDVDDGGISNIAYAAAQDEQGTPVDSPTSDFSVSAVPMPSLSLTKSTTATSYNAVDQTIPYSYLVTNTGNTTVHDIAITDDQIATANIICEVTTLAPNASTVCTGNYSTLQSDIDAGSVTNTATASAQDPQNNAVTSNSSSTTVDATLTPGISLSKSSTTDNYNAPGQDVNYVYTVTNTGNDTLSQIKITDNKISSANILCLEEILPPGGTTMCFGTYSTTQADVDAGSVTNSAIASGQNTQGTSVDSAPSSTKVDAMLSPALSLVKATTTSSFSVAGETIAYTYTVTNSGNNTINSITVSDDKITTVNCLETTLAPAASTTCSGNYTTTQADLDAGNITNIATASGTDLQGDSVTSPSSEVIINAMQISSLSLLKTTTTANYNLPGDTINYNYQVTNTGNVTINSLDISDNKIASNTISCQALVLAPNASTACTGSYTVTQADIDAGSVTNTATASGLNPESVSVTSSPSTVTVTAQINSALALVKTSNSSVYNAPDQVIAYNYNVTNTGNDTINNISIMDDKISTSNISCMQTTLAPAASTTCSGNYVTTQADVDAGSLTNTATASGQNPQLTVVTSEVASVTIPATLNPGLTVVKSTTTTSYNAPGQDISYTYEVTNTGNDTLNAIAINDDKIATITCIATTLAPNTSTTCSGTYVTTQTDIDLGSITNTATASGTNHQGTPITSAVSSVTVNAILTPALTLLKSTTTSNYSLPGQDIVYHYKVTNTGNDTLNNLIINDDKISSATITCEATTLAPGASTECTGTYAVTQADIDTGSITNSASASSTNNQGTTVTSNSSSITVNYVPAGGTITLVKTASTTHFSSPGTAITYSYLITNNGVTVLTNVNLTDSKLGDITCPMSSLVPGSSMTCTTTYVTTFEDMKQGGITNVGTVTALTPSGLKVTGTASVTVTLDAEFIRHKTQAAIKTFLNARAQLVLSDEPDRRRILNRLSLRTQKCSGVPQSTLQPNNDRMAFNASISTSELCMEPSKFDIWSEVHGVYYRQNNNDVSNHGEFGVVYLGVDYLLNSSTIVGVLTEADAINQKGSNLNLPTASGQGWLVGPYLSTRLLPDLYLHTRAAWGGSGNKINPFGLYQDTFSTTRSYYNVELVGDWYQNHWRISPTAGLTYYRETQQRFKNFLGIAIPAQQTNLGQVNAGPEFSYLFKTETDKQITLRLSLQGIYNFNNNDFVEEDIIPVSNLSARVKLGAEYRTRAGFSLTPMIVYDGLGTNLYNSFEAQLQISVPLC